MDRIELISIMAAILTDDHNRTPQYAIDTAERILAEVQARANAKLWNQKEQERRA